MDPGSHAKPCSDAIVCKNGPKNRNRSRLEEDESAGAQDLAHAIALHLAKGNVARASDLSRHFLPTDSSSASSKSAQSGGLRTS